MSVAKQIPDNIKRVARSIGYAAWLNSPECWFGLPVILRARLTTEQRAALAFMVLKSLDYDTACQSADAALGVPLDQGEAA
jgi:hypothetical protein